MQPPVLETPRLRLRGLVEADREPFAEMNADAQVMRYFPAPWDRALSDTWFNRIAEHWSERNIGAWAVEIDSRFAGIVGLQYVPPGYSFAPAVEVLWRLRPEFWGQGYAPEAARRACGYGFREAGLTEIVAYTSVRNRPSLRVMEKLGMRFQRAFLHPRLAAADPLRPHVLYGLGRPADADV